MKKIVINKCYGGFGYSEAAQKKYNLPKYEWDCDRDNPDLIRAVEEMGEKVNDELSELVIVEIPDDVNWVISEYDGMESIEENHRSWS